MPLPNSKLGARGTAALLATRRRVHFLGIGGVQMSSLALRMHRLGFTVTGSDATRGEYVRALCRAGVPVAYGSAAEQVAGVDAVIYSLAIPPTDPAYLAAVSLGLPLLSRADALAYLSAPFSVRVGVAGSHGKSSVTAMLAHVLASTGRDPTVFGGARLPDADLSLREGTGDVTVFEACEYGDSFLSLSPTISVLLSAQLDHTDYFPDARAIERSFARFAALPGEAGTLVANGDDPVVCEITKGLSPRRLLFGESEGDAFARDVRYEAGCARFSLVLHGACVGDVALRVPGRHNLCNALAAALTASVCGVDGNGIAAALGGYGGLSRRMEYKGTWHGARVFDDYAHHPTEIAAVLETARTLGTGRVFAVFQPHTYSRTAAMLDAFAAALRCADRVLITDVYAAREQDAGLPGARALARAIGAHAAHVSTFPAVAATLAQELSPGDTVLVMGAGDTHRLFTHLGLG